MSNRTEEASERFLERDFSECFQMMRHYDSQLLETVKFALAAYSAIAGAALAFYKYGIDHSADYRGPALAVTTVGLLIGIVLFALATRTRVYFVLVTRYINEHRAFFLNLRPFGFPNRTRMYTDSRQPPYFSWRSSQALLLYALALLNAGLLALGLFLALNGALHWKPVTVLGAGAMLLVQLATAVVYLLTREAKSASAAVWGSHAGTTETEEDSHPPHDEQQPPA
ncbi:MAG: hypothetical protein JW952_08780 [Candidatus Eisenbacteria bacterium]|nr:hypothetical protein [Candidatus Eisenbacteria bacterium]